MKLHEIKTLFTHNCNADVNVEIYYKGLRSVSRAEYDPTLKYTIPDDIDVDCRDMITVQLEKLGVVYSYEVMIGYLTYKEDWAKRLLDSFAVELGRTLVFGGDK